MKDKLTGLLIYFILILVNFSLYLIILEYYSKNIVVFELKLSCNIKQLFSYLLNDPESWGRQ